MTSSKVLDMLSNTRNVLQLAEAHIEKLQLLLEQKDARIKELELVVLSYEINIELLGEEKQAKIKQLQEKVYDLYSWPDQIMLKEEIRELFKV